MSCGKRVKKVRETLDLTQAEFGERLGFKWSKVKDIEIGKQKLTPEIALDIEKKFAIDFKWLLTGEGQMLKPRQTSIKEIPSEYAGRQNQSLVMLRVNMMLEEMDEEAQRDVLKYTEEKKLLAELMTEKQRKAG